MAFDWDWAAAKAEVKRALAIDPTNPVTLLSFGGMLSTYAWPIGTTRNGNFARHLSVIHLTPYVIWNLGITLLPRRSIRGIRSRRFESCSRSEPGFAVDSLVPWQDAAGAGQAGGGACNGAAGTDETLDWSISRLCYRQPAVRPKQMRR